MANRRSTPLLAVIYKLITLAALLLTGVGLILSPVYFPVVAKVALLTGYLTVMAAIILAVVICSTDS